MRLGEIARDTQAKTGVDAEPLGRFSRCGHRCFPSRVERGARLPARACYVEYPEPRAFRDSAADMGGLCRS